MNSSLAEAHSFLLVLLLLMGSKQNISELRRLNWSVVEFAPLQRNWDDDHLDSSILGSHRSRTSHYGRTTMAGFLSQQRGAPSSWRSKVRVKFFHFNLLILQLFPAAKSVNADDASTNFISILFQYYIIAVQLHKHFSPLENVWLNINQIWLHCYHLQLRYYLITGVSGVFYSGSSNRTLNRLFHCGIIPSTIADVFYWIMRLTGTRGIVTVRVCVRACAHVCEGVGLLRSYTKVILRHKKHKK